MGYDNFNFGEKLNPSEFNDKFEKLFDLVKKAYEHNNQLRNRLDVLNVAFQHANGVISNATSPFENTDNFYKHGHSGSDNYELKLGGQLFSESYTLTDYTLVSSSNLEYDGQLLLTNTSSVSRIPLTSNPYGETAPSLGVEISSTNSYLDPNRFWMLLSEEAVWADHVETVSGTPGDNWVELVATVPATLTPLVNHIKAVPILDMEYQLAYDTPTGNFVDVAGADPTTWKAGVTNALITSDKFANNLRLRVKSPKESITAGATVFGFGSIEAYYKKFSTSGTAIISVAMGGANGKERILKDFSVSGQNAGGIVIKIGNDSAFDNNTVIVYNSETAGLTQSNATITLGVYDTLYFQVTLNKLNDTSPSISSINMNYEVQP